MGRARRDVSVTVHVVSPGSPGVITPGSGDPPMSWYGIDGGALTVLVFTFVTTFGGGVLVTVTVGTAPLARSCRSPR